MITENVATVAQAAIVASYAGGAALTLAIAGAMVEAMWPGLQNRVGAQVWAGLVWLASMALRLFYLVTCGPFILAYRLAVTYLHVGGRRARHRYSHIQAWREGTYSAQRPAHA